MGERGEVVMSLASSTLFQDGRNGSNNCCRFGQLRWHLVKEGVEDGCSSALSQLRGDMKGDEGRQWTYRLAACRSLRTMGKVNGTFHVVLLLQKEDN